jgi:two-component system response regulator HydG
MWTTEIGMRASKPVERRVHEGQRVLLSFVGSHDPYRADEPGSGDGPLLTLLSFEPFSVVYIFYNGLAYHRRASGVLEALRERSSATQVHYVEIPVDDPTDYEALYGLMQHRSLEIVERHGRRAEYYIATSSGTPQMQTCWLLLVLGGVIPARLVQVTPPHKQRDGESPVREICLSRDRFPRVITPSKLERELAIATRRLGSLEREREASEREVAAGLIGSSKPFRDAIAAAKRLAAYDVPVLITGETGTGKEEFAKVIHFWSRRKDHPFLPINCASLPEAIFESELFGHKKGAFTGADRDRTGLLEAAEGGTVFLDEIGELSPAGQAKLLRVLNDGKYRPVGDTAERQSRARIVAATNRDLRAMVDDGKFREDLLYRISSVAEVRLPPLRDRPGDVVELAEAFLNQFCEKYDRKLRFDPKALEYLSGLPWEGNVRALKGAVERLVINSAGEEITVNDLGLPAGRKASPATAPMVRVGDTPVNLPRILEEWEREMIRQAIERFQGNRSAAARHLGYEEATLRKKARQYLGLKVK